MTKKYNGVIKIYKFIGEGAGVPGLPHEIDTETARKTGVYEILMEAIRNGNYAEVKEAEKEAFHGR